MSKIIGIIGRYDNKDGVSFVKCNSEIINAVKKCGGIPLCILEVDNINTVLDLCDGIIMPGGNDITTFDKNVCKYAIKKDIPILGICLGMQIMSCYNKDEDLKKVLNHNSKNKYVYDVYIKDNTLLSNIVRKTIRVNSRHNECVKDTSLYKVSAVSSDGVIEAIEYDKNKFNLGVQWHPESMIDYDDNAFKLIKYFIDQCQ